MHPTRKNRALPLAGMIALAVAPVAFSAPKHSASDMVADVAPAMSTTLTATRLPTVLPAPRREPAPVVVAVPNVPPLPKHDSPTDAPALAAHANVVREQLTTTAASHADATRKVEQAQRTVAQAHAKLQAVRAAAAAVGAPMPEVPPMPQVPAVTTPAGAPVPVAVTPPTAPAVPAGPPAVTVVDAPAGPVVAQTAAADQVAAVPTLTGPLTGTGAAERTFEQARVAQEAKAVQQQLADAQVQLVTASVVAQVTDSQVETLTAALSTTEQALATLPPPDPRSPDGCPGVAPDGTLRGGADGLGLAKVCADSVAAAPTPQAALAIKWALSHLGMPYSQPLRNEAGYADCSSFVSRAYQSAGVNIAPPGVNAPTTETIADAPWAADESFGSLRPGDLVEPDPGHVVMWLADGFMVHTSTTGDVSHVRAVYFTSGRAFRIDPSNVH